MFSRWLEKFPLHQVWISFGLTVSSILNLSLLSHFTQLSLKKKARRNKVSSSILCLEFSSDKYLCSKLTSYYLYTTIKHISIKLSHFITSTTFPLVSNNMLLISVCDLMKSIFNAHISSNIPFMMIYVSSKMIEVLSIYLRTSF